MARRWHHSVAPQWLEARKHVLTATDVSNIMPEYKRYLKAGSPEDPTPGFLALWAKKNSDSYQDPESTGMAARGHILEPYAINAWNKQVRSKPMYHWDDSLIVDETKHFGFSPDALNIPQEYIDWSVQVEQTRMLGNSSAFEYKLPVAAMEVKSYSPEQHMKAIAADKMKRDELMQIAMAFVVLPTLNVMYLVYYCPGAPIEMYAESYSRDELHDQIRWILEIGEVYVKVDKFMKKKIKTGHWMKALATEEHIYKEYLEEQESNFVIS